MNKLDLSQNYSNNTLIHSILWTIASFSLVLIYVFVRFLSIAEEFMLSDISFEYAIKLVSEIDFLSLIFINDFWSIGLGFESGDLRMFIEPHGIISLLLFSVGLYTYHNNVQTLSSRRVFIFFLAAGWAHLLVAKCILLLGIPILLTGPVVAVGLLSVFYFSFVALSLDAYLFFRKVL
ncbi:hypothetical protein [Alteromonas lipolytica]|uniref:Uncharacterized protein n=1 Tax=Alteromonas lipolytica TaxID=1856405 RepID=A0A1E8FFC8_9ALTE|nr:hypothetical protein [Alteromonas lipolytica]OFI34193.1 hypothetical protein BFC17_21895 [Alteromonas lipolytica]GGF84250.1 hypothetical protein GCM10011338_40690 [Alteromonas lipolytica]